MSQHRKQQKPKKTAILQNTNEILAKINQTTTTTPDTADKYRSEKSKKQQQQKDFPRRDKESRRYLCLNLSEEIEIHSHSRCSYFFPQDPGSGFEEKNVLKTLP